MVPRPASLTRHLLRTAAVGLVAAAAVVGGTNWYAHARSHGRVATTVADTATTDVGIVLGAEIYPNGVPSPFLEGRLKVGAALYHAGKVKVLIVSGDGSSAHYDETTGMKKWLVDRLGVPADKVVIDPHGYDTYDSCKRAKDVFGVTRAVLISQTYHLTRAVATCRAVGVDAWGSGDESVRPYSRVWKVGAAREVLACVKMGVDLSTRRQPTQEPPRDDVTRALGR